MRLAYLLLYNDEFGDRATVKKVVDESSLIITWRFDMPNAFYLISNHTAKEISQDLHQKLPTGRFIVLECTSNSYGWLSSDSWYLLQNKKHKPE